MERTSDYMIHQIYSLGPTVESGSHVVNPALEYTLPVDYPHEFGDLHKRKPLPYSKQCFQKIIERFHLPRATPRLFTTDSSQMQRYSLDDHGSSCARTGNNWQEYIRL